MVDLFIGSLRCKGHECNAENSWRDRPEHTHIWKTPIVMKRGHTQTQSNWLYETYRKTAACSQLSAERIHAESTISLPLAALPASRTVQTTNTHSEHLFIKNTHWLKVLFTYNTDNQHTISPQRSSPIAKVYSHTVDTVNQQQYSKTQ